MEQVAKINHLAITTENYTRAAKFYELAFGMKSSPKWESLSAIAVSDGYVGLNFNSRSAARSARLDHFGIEIGDVEAVLERMREKYPKVQWLQRPASRPFAGITTHDPDGNTFDISKRDRAGVYAEKTELHPRHVSHFALRTLNHRETSEFYRDLFGLQERSKDSNDPNVYLSDGHITMVVMPWQISDYAGTAIQAPCVDHLGFTVESVEKFREDLDRISNKNPQFAPYPLGAAPESKTRLELAKRSCPLCEHILADPEAVLLSVSRAHSGGAHE
jgi:predicted enzyme related to lactoylglutathione lyase